MDGAAAPVETDAEMRAAGKEPIRGRSASPSPPAGRASCYGRFKFRATARSWLVMPNVGANGKRGVLKRTDWPGWRIKGAALPRDALPRPGEAADADADDLGEALPDAELEARRWRGRGCAEPRGDAGVCGIPRILAERGWVARPPRAPTPPPDDDASDGDGPAIATGAEYWEPADLTEDPPAQVTVRSGSESGGEAPPARSPRRPSLALGTRVALAADGATGVLVGANAGNGWYKVRLDGAAPGAAPLSRRESALRVLTPGPASPAAAATPRRDGAGDPRLEVVGARVALVADGRAGVVASVNAKAGWIKVRLDDGSAPKSHRLAELRVVAPAPGAPASPRAAAADPFAPIRVGARVEAEALAFGDAYAESVGRGATFRGVVISRGDDEGPRGRVWGVRYDEDGQVWDTSEWYLRVVGGQPRPKKRRKKSDDVAAAPVNGAAPKRKNGGAPPGAAPKRPRALPAATSALEVVGARVALVADGRAGVVVAVNPQNKWIKVRLDGAPAAASYRPRALRLLGATPAVEDAADSDDDAAAGGEPDALYDADGAAVDADLAAVLEAEASAYAAARAPAGLPAPAPPPLRVAAGDGVGAYLVGDRVEVLHFKGRPTGRVVAVRPPGYDVRLDKSGVVWPLDPCVLAPVAPAPPAPGDDAGAGDEGGAGDDAGAAAARREAYRLDAVARGPWVAERVAPGTLAGDEVVASGGGALSWTEAVGCETNLTCVPKNRQQQNGSF